MNQFHSALATCLLSVVLSCPAFAAPPSVTGFFPAGMQAGTTATVTVNGKIGDRPVSVWCSRDDLSIELDEKKSEFRVTAPPEATPGPCWIRLSNAEGASSVRPFAVGTLKEFNETEPNETPEKANTLELSQMTVNGRLAKSGDVDTFSVSLKTGDTLVASLAAHEFGSPMDGVLQVLSPEGFVLLQNDDARGIDPLCVFPVPKDGVYSVRVFAFPETPNSSIRFAGGSTYIYRLTLTTGPFLDHVEPMAVTSDETPLKPVGWNLPKDFSGLTVTRDNLKKTAIVSHPMAAGFIGVPIVSVPTRVESQEANTIPIPVSIHGSIDSPGDTDIFKFDAKKNDTLVFRAESRAFRQELDPVLRLLNAKDSEIARVDDPKRNEFDAVLERKIPSDGTYQIEVSDLFGHGGLRYAYQLQIAPKTADFSMTVEADAFAVKAGESLKIPVTIARVNGFSAVIEVAATGLPDGVSAKPVRSEAKGDSSKKVELELTTAKDMTFNQPFQIVGKPVDTDTVQEHPATATAPGAFSPIADLWLTVRKP
ncbi:pre-peptidase C-terminal domain-containing protein [Thalassoroseus pseudoceratinae]|uniref:pre-peptidase C-terminal domain-containing protein n=1 Tax=Thalassoroseus pseudoceratinae TaxID=2713176 RepID=UPI001420D9E9|nr:pre-peptidase C-terminal domain-containing protein [Thalassoroseus pseudoceratinae]